MYYALFTFMVLYPFLIYPWGSDPYYTEPKAMYLSLFTMAVWCILLIRILRSRPKNLSFLRVVKPAEWMAVSFLVLVSVSASLSVDPLLSITGESLRYEGLTAFVSYVTIFVFSYRFIPYMLHRRVLGSVFYCSLPIALYGILQRFHLDFLPRHSLKGWWTRSFSFFDNPDFFGSYLVLMIILGCGIYMLTDRKRGAVASLATLCTLVLALIYTETRSAWLGTLTGLAMLSTAVVVKHRELISRWLVLLVAFGLVFAMANVYEGGTFSRHAQTIVDDAKLVATSHGEEKLQAGSDRWYIWTKALPLVAEYPLFGSGPDTFALVFPHDPQELFRQYGLAEMKVDKAHNEYLQMAITLGVPALAVYMCLVFYVGVVGFRKALSSSGSKALLNWGVTATIAGYLVQAFFNISVITVAPLFWAILGMAYREGTWADVEEVSNLGQLR